MNDYPEVAAKIAADYLERLKSHLRLVPVRERNEFLMEIQSHLYEAYQQTAGDDEVTRILGVLRKLGEPAEVVADRLPGAMFRSGTRRSLPLYVLGGILIGLFGIPLGFSGVAALLGILAALAGVLLAYYAVAGSLLLVGGTTMLLGLTRLYKPEIYDRMVTLGYLKIDWGFLDQLSAPSQGLILIVAAGAVAAAGWGMLRLGSHLVRGLRFLFALTFEWTRKAAQRARKELRYRTKPATAPFGPTATPEPFKTKLTAL